MVSHRILGLAFLATLLSGTSVLAQSHDDGAVLRLQLPSKIIFSGGTNPGGGPTNPGGGPTNPVECGAEGMPPCGETNLPLDIRLPEGFRFWATVGDSFGPLEISGGKAPYNVNLAGGIKPPGLSFDGAAIGGVYGAPGIYSINLGVTDASTPAKVDDTGTFEMEVADPLSIADYSDPVLQATVGVPLSLPAPAVSGGTPPYTFATPLTDGSFSTANGQIDITPTATAPIGPFTIGVSDQHDRADETAPVTINVSEPLSATSPATKTLRVGVAGVLDAPAVAGGRGTKSFSLASGAPPSGMSLNGSGAASGTPSVQCGACSYSVRVTDVDGRTVNATIPYKTIGSLLISEPGASSYAWRLGVAITPITLTVSNNLAPAAFVTSVGSLPPGIQLVGDGTTATISGTPTSTANESIRISATEQGIPGAATDVTEAFNIAVTRPTVTVGASFLAEAETAWSTTPTYGNLVSTGPNTRTFSLLGAPSGMTVSASGVVTWTSPVQGSYNDVTIRVNDKDGSYGTGVFDLEVTPVGPKNGGTTSATWTSSGSGSNASPRVVTWTYPVTVYVNRVMAQLKAYKSGGFPAMTWKLEKADTVGGTFTQVANGSGNGSSGANSSANAAWIGPANQSITQVTGRVFRITLQAASGTTQTGSAPGVGTPDGFQ